MGIKEAEEKHCWKCSYQSEEGLVVTGCAYCGCHDKPINAQIIERTDEVTRKELLSSLALPKDRS